MFYVGLLLIPRYIERKDPLEWKRVSQKRFFPPVSVQSFPSIH